jgi:hypothetical protein
MMQLIEKVKSCSHSLRHVEQHVENDNNESNANFDTKFFKIKYNIGIYK